jgi:hypothetical protein
MAAFGIDRPPREKDGPPPTLGRPIQALVNTSISGGASFDLGRISHSSITYIGVADLKQISSGNATFWPNGHKKG